MDVPGRGEKAHRPSRHHPLFRDAAAARVCGSVRPSLPGLAAAPELRVLGAAAAAARALAR